MVIGATLLGIVIAQFLPSKLGDLMNHDAHGAHGAEPEVGLGEDASLWTCAMHPHVLEHGPGPCPICGMNLTEVAGSSGAPHARPAASTGEREILFYRHPMDPEITSPVPAQDSMGMDYVAVYSDDESVTSSTLRIEPAVIQKMNVRTERVELRDLHQPIRTVGYLEYDQQRMVTVTTKYSGWVEKVYVNYVGEKVRRGQPLFEIYSPELVQTEQELLSAIAFAKEMDDAPEDTRQRTMSMIESARERLGYWDVSAQQVARLEETGEVLRTLKVSAPADGLVMKRMAGLEGMAVHPGMELFHLSDLSSLWLSVELFEDQLGWVREGTPAEISLSYFPGESFTGKVRFMEPELSEKTRTIRAKIEVPNPDERLRTGMYATVEFQPLAIEDAVAVPTQAVLRTGQRSVVVIALGEGYFEPREVTLGHQVEGYAEVLSGLEPGEEVVTSAQFLIDSESKLRDTIQKMIAQDRSLGDLRTSPTTPDHGAHAGH